VAKKGGNIAGLTLSLAKGFADELGLTLWDVVYEKEGSLWYLRVYIEKPDAVLSIDDCVAMTRPLDKALDELDPTDESYILEVSSPGLGRKLVKDSHFESYVGEPVKIRFVREQEGLREITGILKSFNKETVIILTGDNEKEIRRADTAYIKADDEDIFADFDE
jgi:ribosome maturation factor RimP